ncbi:MAG TPA: amidohydrolase family protein [Longimicrobiaceae bacterium]
MSALRIDVHVHLAGVGTGGSGCWLSPRFVRRYTFRILRRLSGISDAQMRESVDQDWAAAIAERVRGSELDRAVALGFDGVYDAAGELDPERSQMVVPPSWVLEACRRHPELLPGPSVNPGRRDALERLEECIEGGAVLLKWLPSAMGIDPADPRHRPFYRRMADAGLPLLSHSGGSERTFAEVAPEYMDLRRLRLPLEEGVPVIVAHNGVPVHLSRDEDQLPLLREMLREFPHLWVDNSGIANPSRFAHLPRLARDAEFTERTLYGSDYPVPAHAMYYVPQLGARRVRSIQGERNPFQRDVVLKRALGYPEATLTRAARVLPNVRRPA